MTHNPTDALLGRLNARGLKVRGAGPRTWQAQCPAHEDRNPSLSIREGDDGTVLLKCHANCPTPAVVAALGLTEADLFPPREPGRRPAPAPRPSRNADPATWPRGGYPDAEGAILDLVRTLMPDALPRTQNITHYFPKPEVMPRSWTYHRADGAEALRIVRLEGRKGKQYRPIHPGPDGYWRIADPPGLLPLYRMADWVESDQATIFVAEGEKCADILADLGLPATTSAHGAGAAKKTDWSPLAGRSVVIVPDNDGPGRKYAREVARLLAGLDVPAEVRVLDLPGLAPGDDLEQWVAAESAPAGVLAARLDGLASAAPAADAWDPDPAAPIPIPDPTPHPAPAPAPAAPALVLTRMADVTPEAIRWLWPGRIPLGKVTMLAGDPGLGKSFLTLDLAARVSRGAGWPDSPLAEGGCWLQIDAEPAAGPRAPHPAFVHGSALLLSAEDGLADTIRPRLDAAGADLSRVFALEAGRGADGAPTPFSLKADLARLDELVASMGNVRLIVIDPVSAYVGEVDDHKNAQVRSLLMPLSDLANRRGIAVVLVSHLNKAAGGKAIYRSMGSLAFMAAARAGFVVVKERDDPDRRLILPVKCNIAAEPTGLAYSIRDGRVAWESAPISLTADEALADEAAEATGQDAPSKVDECADWLRAHLADGPIRGERVLEQARSAGFRQMTVKRAKAAAEIVSRREGFGPNAYYVWAVPDLMF